MKKPTKPARPQTKQPTVQPPEDAEVVAHAAVEHLAPESLPGHKVKLALTVYLTRAQAERLTVNAIREGKNLGGLVSEILEAWRPEGSRTRGTTRGPG